MSRFAIKKLFSMVKNALGYHLGPEPPSAAGRALMLQDRI